MFRFLSQTRLIFPGAAATQGKPDAIVTAGPGGEIVQLCTRAGVRIAALYGKALDPNGRLIPGAPSLPTLLYFYGNGSSLSRAADEIDGFRRLGCNVFCPEYQGYGMSDGDPGETGCYASADAAFEELTLRRQIEPRQIIIAGRSLGSAVAIDLASRHPGVAALIAISPFTSMRDMARRVHPFLPTRLLLRHFFDNLAKVPSLPCPILFVHGTQDTLVPPAVTDRLAAEAKVPVTRLAIPDANHANIMELSGDFLWKSLSHFLNSSGAKSRK